MEVSDPNLPQERASHTTHACAFPGCGLNATRTLVLHNRMHPDIAGMVCGDHEERALWDCDRCSVGGCDFRAVRLGRCEKHLAPHVPRLGLPAPERLRDPAAVEAVKALPPPPEPDERKRQPLNFGAPKPARKQHTCARCGGPSERLWSKYCSDSCRNREARARYEARKAATTTTETTEANMARPPTGKYPPQHERRELVSSQLIEHPDGVLVSELTNRLGYPQTYVRRALEELLTEGRAHRTFNGDGIGVWHAGPATTDASPPVEQAVPIPASSGAAEASCTGGDDAPVSDAPPVMERAGAQPAQATTWIATTSNAEVGEDIGRRVVPGDLIGAALREAARPSAEIHAEFCDGACGWVSCPKRSESSPAAPAPTASPVFVPALGGLGVPAPPAAPGQGEEDDHGGDCDGPEDGEPDDVTLAALTLANGRIGELERDLHEIECIVTGKTFVVDPKDHPVARKVLDWMLAEREKARPCPRHLTPALWLRMTAAGFKPSEMNPFVWLVERAEENAVGRAALADITRERDTLRTMLTQIEQALDRAGFNTDVPIDGLVEALLNERAGLLRERRADAANAIDGAPMWVRHGGLELLVIDGVVRGEVGEEGGADIFEPNGRRVLTIRAVAEGDDDDAAMARERDAVERYLNLNVSVARREAAAK
jgi:hypothetical protein